MTVRRSYSKDGGCLTVDDLVSLEHIGANSITADGETFVLLRMAGSRKSGAVEQTVYALTHEMVASLFGVLIEQSHRDGNLGTILMLLKADLRMPRG